MIDVSKLGVFGQIHSDSVSSKTDVLRLDGDGCVRSGGKLNEHNIFRRIGRDVESNNAVRTQFLQALGEACGIKGATVDGKGRVSFSAAFVKAMTERFGAAIRMSDFGLDRKGFVTSGKPLTERRVSLVMDKVWAENGVSVKKPFVKALSDFQLGTQCLPFPKGIGERDAEKLLRHCQQTGGLRQGLVSWMKEVLLEAPDASRPEWAQEKALYASAAVDENGKLEDTSADARLEAGINKVLDGFAAKTFLKALEKTYAVCKDIKSIASHEADNAKRTTEVLVAPGASKTAVRLSVGTDRLLDQLRGPLAKLGIQMGPGSKLVAEEGKLGLYLDAKKLSPALQKKLGKQLGDNLAFMLGTADSFMNLKLTLDVQVVKGKLRVGVPLDGAYYTLPKLAEEKLREKALEHLPKDSSLLKASELKSHTEEKDVPVWHGWKPFIERRNVQVADELLAVTIDPAELFGKVAAKTAVGLEVTGFGVGPGGLVCELGGKAQTHEVRSLTPTAAPEGTVQAELKFGGLEVPVKSALKNVGVHFKKNGGISFEAAGGGKMRITLSNLDLRETAGTALGYGPANRAIQTFAKSAGKWLSFEVRPKYDAESGKLHLKVDGMDSGSVFLNLVLAGAKKVGLLGRKVQKAGNKLSEGTGKAAQSMKLSSAKKGLAELEIDVKQLLPPALRGVAGATSLKVTEEGLSVSVRDVSALKL